jgi:hypothetical protein
LGDVLAARGVGESGTLSSREKSPRQRQFIAPPGIASECDRSARCDRLSRTARRFTQVLQARRMTTAANRVRSIARRLTSIFTKRATLPGSFPIDCCPVWSSPQFERSTLCRCGTPMAAHAASAIAPDGSCSPRGVAGHKARKPPAGRIIDHVDQQYDPPASRGRWHPTAPTPRSD